MNKSIEFPNILYLTETKFAKDCVYEWPYDVESANMILDHCCSNTSLQELVSDYIFCFKDKNSMVSTVWDSSDDNVDYESDWDPREWDGCDKSTVRFYQDNRDWQTNLLHEECLTQLCPKIKDWDYSTIVCSALFCRIQDLLETEKQVHQIYWKKWMSILLDSRFGAEFQDIIERNALFETCSKQVSRGFRLALPSLPSMWFHFFFKKTSPDQFIRVLQVLKLPDNQIQELMNWTFENQDLSKLLSFLDTYTFTEFTLELFDEFLESLPLTEKEQKQILEDMHTQLEIPTIWGSTLDDFFVSTQIENYQELITQEQNILKKAFLLAIQYKNQLQKDSNVVLYSIPPLCVLEKYLSNLDTKDYKKLKKTLFVNQIKTTYKLVALFLILVGDSQILVGGGIMPSLANREIVNTVIIRDDQFYAEKQLQKTANFGVSRIQPFRSGFTGRPQINQVLDSNRILIHAEMNFKKGEFKEFVFASAKKGNKTLDLLCSQDTEGRVTLIGVVGKYSELRFCSQKFKDFQKKVQLETNPSGIVFPATNFEADHVIPHLLGRAMGVRGRAGGTYDGATAVLTTPAVNKIRTRHGQFIRKTSYTKSSILTYKDLLDDSFKHVETKLNESEYSVCKYFQALKHTKADHVDRLFQGYEQAKNIVTNQLEQIYLERDELESNLVIPYIEHKLYGLALAEDIESFKNLSLTDDAIKRKIVNDFVTNVVTYTQHTSGLLPYYRATKVENHLEEQHESLLQQYRSIISETSRTYPTIPEFKSALIEIENSRLDPNQSQTWEELDKTAQDLGLNNVNGRQGRIFF